MSKLKKCLYLIDLLSRKGSMSLKEINDHYQYSSLYDGEIIPRTFARYKDYIAETFPCYIDYNQSTNQFTLSILQMVVAVGTLVIQVHHVVLSMTSSTLAKNFFAAVQREYTTVQTKVVVGILVTQDRHVENSIN